MSKEIKITRTYRLHTLIIGVLFGFVGGVLFGFVCGICSDSAIKPVHEIQTPACKDIMIDWSFSGEHECPHPNHRIKDQGFRSVMCTCERKP